MLEWEYFKKIPFYNKFFIEFNLLSSIFITFTGLYFPQLSIHNISAKLFSCLQINRSICRDFFPILKLNPEKNRYSSPETNKTMLCNKKFKGLKTKIKIWNSRFKSWNSFLLRPESTMITKFGHMMSSFNNSGVNSVKNKPSLKNT